MESGSAAKKANRGALGAAMAHPLRGRVLFVVADKPRVSIRQIAARLDESPSRVRRQLQALEKNGLVEVVSRRNRRGGVEYLYSATTEPSLWGDEGGVVSPEQQRAAALEILRLVLSDATAAVRAGTFGSGPGHSEVRAWGEVDQEGWEELAAIHLRACKEVKAALAAAGERVRETGAERRAATSTMFLFESGGWPADE
jgi:DNA-binding transcriptional ArsR family regulator